MSLIPTPLLDDRDAEQLAAEAIARTSGGLTAVYLRQKVAALHALIALVEAGDLDAPICDELTNANPSSPHVVILEAQAWLVEQQKRVLNLLPETVRIEFANLFIEMRAAQAATTTLQFSLSAEALAPVNVLAGTFVSTEDGAFLFSVNEEVVVAPDASVTVAATRTVAGATVLAPNQLTRHTIVNQYLSVTNPELVDSGAPAETVEQALTRARNYQRRGERWVSAKDVEEGILEDVLFGNGIVKAFDLVEYPNWETRKPGYTTIVAMTKTGTDLSDEIMVQIKQSLPERVGSIFFDVIGPQNVSFDIQASIKVLNPVAADAIKARVEKNLREFYAARENNFGRRISRSEIIQKIEDTEGVDRIATEDDEPILEEPVADLAVAPYELPKLVNVELTVVP